MKDEFNYIGDELDLFNEANNWKLYWKSIIEPYVGKKILDVGGGLGATRLVFKSSFFTNYTIVEPDTKFCKIMKDKFLSQQINNTNIFNGYLKDMDIELFDTILYIDVLEHIEDDLKEINIAKNFIKPSGRIIVLSPAHNHLYSSFDKAIGHFRRYNKKTLSQLCPKELSVEKTFYLDSAGYLLSLANKAILNSSNPTKYQIYIWDKFFVRLSKIIDSLIRYNFGKTIVTIYKKS